MFPRSIKVLIPALIAGATLMIAHVKKHQLKFSKYFLAALAGSLFFAIELTLSRLVLEETNGITFYFLRCIFVLAISYVIFRPKFSNNIDKTSKINLVVAGVIWVIHRVIVYFGYVKLGVIETTLVIMLGPVLLYFFAWKFLKEKLTKKNVITSVIILACILYATFA